MKVLKLFCIVLLLFVFGCSNKHEFIGSGRFDHAEYLQGNFGSSDKTIIYFKDGSNVIIEGCLVSIPCQEGELITIYKNDNGWDSKFVFEKQKIGEE